MPKKRVPLTNTEIQNRIEALEDGDLKSKIEIIGEDELADLS